MGETFKAFRDDPARRIRIVTGAGEWFFGASWDLKAAADGDAVDGDQGVVASRRCWAEHDAVDGDQGVGGFAGLQEVLGRTCR